MRQFCPLELWWWEDSKDPERAEKKAEKASPKYSSDISTESKHNIGHREDLTSLLSPIKIAKGWGSQRSCS
jgi:hypothetical protein